MRKVHCILFIITLMCVYAQNSDSLIDKAVQLYESRHLNEAYLNQSRDILTGVAESEPENLRAHYELSHIYYLLGDNAVTKDEKLDLYKIGKSHGKKAKGIDGNSADAHFWYMVNLGRIGQTKGVLNSLASVPEIKKEIDKVLSLDPDHIGALDARAMLYYELPPLLGGNINASVEALDKAIAVDSNFTLLYVDMAKCQIKKKEYEKARWYLNRALQIENPTQVADHILDDKPEAESLLEEIKDK